MARAAGHTSSKLLRPNTVGRRSLSTGSQDTESVRKVPLGRSCYFSEEVFASFAVGGDDRNGSMSSSAYEVRSGSMSSIADEVNSVTSEAEHNQNSPEETKVKPAISDVDLYSEHLENIFLEMESIMRVSELDTVDLGSTSSFFSSTPDLFLSGSDHSRTWEQNTLTKKANSTSIVSSSRTGQTGGQSYKRGYVSGSTSAALAGSMFDNRVDYCVRHDSKVLSENIHGSSKSDSVEPSSSLAKDRERQAELDRIFAVANEAMRDLEKCRTSIDEDYPRLKKKLTLLNEKLEMSWHKLSISHKSLLADVNSLWKKTGLRNPEQAREIHDGSSAHVWERSKRLSEDVPLDILKRRISRETSV